MLLLSIISLKTPHLVTLYFHSHLEIQGQMLHFIINQWDINHYNLYHPPVCNTIYTLPQDTM